MQHLINDCINPYFNLALEEYLFNRKDEYTYFWLWRNDNTVVIGKNQDTFSEINSDFVCEQNIKVARRMTGGGAVYHDLGNLNFSFITPNAGKKDYDFKRFTDIIAQALGVFGIRADYSGRNDLLIDGKKFSGNAQFVGASKTLHHGTLLFSSDIGAMEQSLTPAREKLKSHGVPSVRSRVTTIAEHLPNKIGIERFQNELARQVCLNYSDVQTRRLTQEETETVTVLAQNKYSTYDWIYGASSAFNYSKSMRFDRCGTIHLNLLLQAGLIKDCRITGDFFGSGDITQLEAQLIGLPCDKASLQAALESVDLNQYFGHLDMAEFLLLL